MNKELVKSDIKTPIENEKKIDFEEEDDGGFDFNHLMNIRASETAPAEKAEGFTDVEDVNFNFMKRVEGTKRDTIRKSDGKMLEI